MDRSPFQLTGFPPNCLCATFPGYAPRRAIIAPVSRSDKPASLPQHCISLGGASHWRYLSADRRLHRSNPQRCQARRPTSRRIEQVRAGHQHADRQDARAHRATVAPRYRRRGDRMMKRRDFITLLGGAAAAWPLAARAQQPVKLPTIGFLGTEASVWNPWTAAFVQRLRELGWTEGRNIAIEYRWSKGRPARHAEIAAEFVRMKVDVIVTNAFAASTVKQATSVIPIVFPLGIDPVGGDLIASLARPVGNVTGLTTQASDLAGKRLELLREVLPRLRRLATIGNVGFPQAMVEMGEVQAVARTLGIEVAPLEIRRAEDIAPAFEALKG